MMQNRDAARGFLLVCDYPLIYSTRSELWSCRGSKSFYRRNFGASVDDSRPFTLLLSRNYL